MTNHEDNERHFKAWRDKNSWRRDIARLEHQYGGKNPYPERTQEWSDFEMRRIDLRVRAMESQFPPAGTRPYTDEFTVPVMDVIHHLLEAFLFVPRGECSRCGAEIRVSRNDRGPHLCTIDSMLDSL